jgi:hypothetical protein
VGAGLALLYVTVALATSVLSSRPVLPLFDGFAPPTPYAWVNPPPDRAGDNVAPGSTERDFPLGPEGTPASNASTDDAQAIVGLDAGSVPANPPDTDVRVRLVPVDAGTLGALPAGLRAVSNAYQVTVGYLPSQTPVTELAVKGTIALTAAEDGEKLLYSPDGQTWQETAPRPYGQDHGVFTELERAGWFVVATSSSGSPTEVDQPDLRRVVLLVILGLVPIIGAFLVLRLPSPVPAAPPPVRRASTSSRTKAKKKNKRRR